VQEIDKASHEESQFQIAARRPNSTVAHLSPFPATPPLTAEAAMAPQTANLRQLCRCFYY
jgi:hypothetical protein